MTDRGFRVRPLARYDGARYPAPAPLPGEEEERDSRLLLQLMACVFALLLVVWVGACGIDPADLSREQHAVLDDQSGNDNDDDKDACAPGTTTCANAEQLAVCDDQGQYSFLSCEAHCDDKFGTVDAYSLGCNDNAADPCQCEYDVMDGGMPMCEPGTMFCSGDTLAVCIAEYGEYDYLDCNEDCQRLYGDDAYSLGCDVNAPDPCQCEYGMTPGIMVQCNPGDVVCSDPETLAICNDSYAYDYTGCDAWCADTYGYGTYSLGCDSQASEPCQCEYDVIAGEMPACLPEDIICYDDATVGICGDYWDYTPINCDDYCAETVGAGSTSSGCDETDPEDPCGCS